MAILFDVRIQKSLFAPPVSSYLHLLPYMKKLLKFIYSEKATKFCEIFPLLLTTVYTVKSKVKISQNFVAFSKYMKFTGGLCRAAQVHQGGETEGEHGPAGLEVGEGGDVGAGQHGEGKYLYQV